jgi:RHS repeat-associated protein
MVPAAAINCTARDRVGALDVKCCPATRSKQNRTASNLSAGRAMKLGPTLAPTILVNNLPPPPPSFYTNTCPSNYKFEGKERDLETGNDDFGARYYSNRSGRWLNADWSAVPAPVPYANHNDPQTLNLYAIVLDDPESYADLDGHQQDPAEEPKSEGREDPDAELLEVVNRALRARAEIQQQADAIAREQFEAAHPEGYDNPFTGDCIQGRLYGIF